MKKFLLSLLFLCLCGTIAFADIIVISKDKTVRYPDGTKLKINADEDITIIYQGTVLVVPRGESVSVRCSGPSEGYSVFVTSDSGFKNVKIGDKSFNSRTAASIVVEQSGDVSVKSGTVSVVNKDNQVSVLNTGKSTTVENKEALDKANAVVDNIEKVNRSVEQEAILNSTDVTDVEKNKTAYEQASKDEDISPSAPRN